MLFPEKASQTLLEDAAKRDQTTARRKCLLNILWRERHLTRAGLIARVEGVLEAGCFGANAWKDTFYRDMRIVKQAFKAAGYQLAYSRRLTRPGYYLRRHPPLHPDLVRILAGSISEVDPAQITIYRKLSPAERFRQGCSISDTARKIVAYRIQQRQPKLTLVEALRLALSQNTTAWVKN